MSTAIAAADGAADAPKKKGKLKKLILFIVLPLILIGGGVGGGLYFAKGTKGHEAEDPDRPKLVVREGEHAPSGPEPAKPDPKLYKATYYPMETTFTANLRDTDSFVQATLGVSTYYDEKVIEHLKDNDMPVRSAVLLTLSEQDPDTIGTVAGKTRLQRELKDAINKVLVAKEGFGGVDDVYFTSLVIQ